MFSISRALRITDLPAPLALCCHDAGAANLIAAWVAAEPARAYRLCAEGPARAVFARACPQLQPLPLSKALGGASCLVSGSGWASDLEHNSRKAAASQGVPSLAVLDHWVNYRMRFVRNDLEVLPDAFVVTDEDARAVARETFGDLRPIVSWSNRYLENEVARVKELAMHRSISSSCNLLVALEPIREDWISTAREPAEFRALDYLMENLHALAARPQDLIIRLRPHPSEGEAKYEPWVHRRKDIRIQMSGSPVLAEDLAWADVVAGLHSYALIVALAAGRRAVSYLPPGSSHCLLRDSRLERLVDLTRRSL